MTGGRAPRQKGSRAERALGYGLAAERVPLSGAAGADAGGNATGFMLFEYSLKETTGAPSSFAA
jgi:hypothetical protein